VFNKLTYLLTYYLLSPVGMLMSVAMMQRLGWSVQHAALQQ